MRAHDDSERVHWQITAVDLNLLLGLLILVAVRIMSANMRGCTFWRNLKYDFSQVLGLHSV